MISPAAARWTASPMSVVTELAKQYINNRQSNKQQMKEPKQKCRTGTVSNIMGA